MAKAPKHRMPESRTPSRLRPSRPRQRDAPDHHQRVIAAHEAGEVDVAGAVTHAAVHAWYEGHIQGEDACPGCKYRGKLPKQQLRGWLPRGSTPN